MAAHSETQMKMTAAETDLKHAAAHLQLVPFVDQRAYVLLQVRHVGADRSVLLGVRTLDPVQKLSVLVLECQNGGLQRD